MAQGSRVLENRNARNYAWIPGTLAKQVPQDGRRRAPPPVVSSPVIPTPGLPRRSPEHHLTKAPVAATRALGGSLVGDSPGYKEAAAHRPRMTARCGAPACSHGPLPAEDQGAILSFMAAPLSRITVDPLVCGGQPCVRGLRIPVAVVLKYLAAGKTTAEVIEEFPELEADDISDCLRYAAWLASGRVIALPPAA
jgi:uncharacterized protein (DUF433 family)